MKTKPNQESSATQVPELEKANVAVEVLVNRTKIGNAICAIGPCSFPLTKTQAKELEELGCVRITGIF